MSSVIAIVKSIVGQVYAMSPEGFQRLIVEGDRLFKGDQLLTGNEGMATLELTDGRTVDLGQDSQWSDAVAAADAPPAQLATQTPADDVAQLQKAIEAGADPTKELEATAAGPGAGGASGSGGAGGGHSFVMLDATAANVDPTIGFATDTAPLTTEALDEEEALPLDAAQPQDSLPSETVPVPDGPNSSPQGQGTSITTDEDTPVQGQLSANDPDGDTLTYSLDSGPRNGTLVINPNGSYTYTPNSNFNGSDSFTAIVDDGKGGTDAITVTIGVNPVNYAPAAANDGPVSATEDTPASGNVLSNDSDADGDSLTVTQFNVGGSIYQAGQTAVINGVGSLVINANGSYTFTPAANYTGAVPTATYTVSDGSLTDTGELSFADVSPVNDAPAAGNDGPVAVTEDTPASGNVLANDTDADGDSLTVTEFIFGGSTYQAGQTAVINGVGSLVINANGSYTFTPAPNYNGPVPTATYTLSDGSLTDTAELSFGNVAPVNDAPETAAVSGSGNEDTPGIPVALSGSDIDGSVANFVIKSLPANGALLLNGVALAIGDSVPATGNGATVTFVPAANWNGTTSFDYTSVDNQGVEDSSPATGTITVASVNDAPETAAASGSGNEDAAGISVALSGSDIDGSVANFVIKSLPANGTLLLNGVALAIGDSVPATGNGATVNFVPNASWNGTTTFQYASVDNQGLEDGSPATGTITVASVNDAPETAAALGSGNEDNPISVNLSGSDSDGAIDHFVIKALPANGTLLLNGVALAIGAVVPATANGASITFVPNANWNGTTTFQYASVDNQGLEDGSPATGTITVASVNDAPETAAALGSGNEDNPISVNLSGSDSDGAIDHFVIKALPANGTLLLNGVALAIGAVVSATANGASITFVPNANWNGTTSFQYASVDNQGQEDSSPATGTITVASVNDAPETAAASGSGNEDAPGIPVALAGSDIDGSVANFVIKSLPANGTLLLNGVALNIGDSVPATGNGATVNFVPNANWNGTTSFDYASVDNQGLEDSSPATGTITVASVNNAPETAAASGAGNEDAPGIPVALSGSDLDGTVDHFVIKSLPANGTLLLNGVALAIGSEVPASANGASITFVPNANWNGTTDFDYASVDNQGLEDSSPATGTITVASVNDTPETAATSGSGNEDSAGIPVALSGSDLDGTVDHFVIKSLPANGTLLLNGVALAIGSEVPATANGASITFVPNANWNGTTSFGYASVDNQGLEDSSPATGTITVASVNDAPETAAASGSGNEDSAGIPVALSGSDLDGTVDHFVIKSLPANGTLLLNGVALAIGDSVPASSNGATVTFVPNANWYGTTSFGYASVDNQGLEDSSPATGTITVASVNDAPETANSSSSGDEDTPGIPVALSGSDLDGSVGHFNIKSLPANGTLFLNGVALTIGSEVPAAANGASITFVPNTNWNGSTTFQYASVDNQGQEDSSPATGTITVASVNNAPETAAASGSGNEDAAGIPVALSGSDLDGNVDHFVIKSLPADGTLLLNGVALALGDSVPATANGAAVTFLPNANWNGTTSFQYASADNQGLEDSSPATGTITVASINDAPETAAASASGNEDSAGIPVALSGSDLDGTVDHFVIKSLPANGTLLLNGIALNIGDSVPASGNGATVTFVPNTNWNGSTTFQYASVDSQGLEDSSPATGTVTVASVNDAPETAATSASGNEDAAGIPVALSGSDVDGTVANFVIKSLPADGTLLLNGVALAIGDSVPATGNGAAVTFVPSANWNGTTTFQYASVDNQGLEDSSPATGTISVVSVNDAPETTAASGSGNEDSAGIPVALSGSDADGTVANFVIKSLPANGTLLLNGVALNIGDSVPASGNGATVTFVPNANWNGSTNFQYASVDSQGLEDSSPATGTITVASVNDAPETAATSASGNEDAAGISVALSGSDVDGTVANFVIKSLPADGTLLLNGVALALGDSVPATGNGATVTFVPSANWNGTTTFQYASVDSQGLEDSSPATGTISVVSVNDAPETTAASGSGNEDSAGIPVALSGSDADGTVANFVIKSLPANGTLLLNGVALNIGDSVPASGNGATVTFVPNANWNGTTTFQYASVDNQGLEDSSPATGTITVVSANDAPVAMDSNASTEENTVLQSAVPAASDTDGTISSYALVSGPGAGNGTLTFNGNGSYTFNPGSDFDHLAAGESRTLNFTYTATDNDGATSAPATITITVTGTNDGPVFAAVNLTANVSEEGLVNGLPDTTGSPTDVSNALVASGTFAISDVDSQNLSVTLTAPTTNLTSNGIPLTWSGNGTSTLSASAGGNPIMTVSITSAGAYLVTLLGQVDHLQANAEDVLSFSVGVTASDGLTSISSALLVRIEDDAPLLATPMQAILLDSSGATAIGDLNLSTGADINGASVQFSTTTGVSVDASGNILSTTLNKDGSVNSSSSYITYQGSKLHYVAGANSLTAVSSDGTEVFKITADPASGQYQVTNFVSLDSPSSTFTSFDLSGGNSGSYDLGTGSRFSLQATATSNGVADTVNTSNNSFGVGSSQSIDTGDLLSFTFIDKSTNQATDLTAISVTTDKLGTGENLTWTAFDIAGNAVGSGTVNGVSGGTTSFTIDASKLNSGEYEFSTIRFGAGASTSYKLLISSITGQTEAYDQRISLGVKATDGDGDSTTTQSLQITFDSDDTIQAGSNDFALGGGNGANNLLGGVGDDILTGGKGSDTLTGGSGADSFVWKAGDAGSAGSPDQDVVKDFNTSQDDRLNLSDLLQGETTSTIDNFLKLIVDSGTGNATLLVSKDGHLNDGGNAASHADLSITLEGAAAQLSGSSISSLIAGADPTIKVDHS